MNPIAANHQHQKRKKLVYFIYALSIPKTEILAEGIYIELHHQRERKQGNSWPGEGQLIYGECQYTDEANCTGANDDIGQVIRLNLRFQPWGSDARLVRCLNELDEELRHG